MKNLLSRIIKSIFGKRVVSTSSGSVKSRNIDDINFTRADLFLRKSILVIDAWQSHYNRHAYSFGGYRIVYDLVIYAGEDAYAFEIGHGAYQASKDDNEDKAKRIVFEKNINSYPDIDFFKKSAIQSVDSFIDDLLRETFYTSELIEISNEEVKNLCVEVIKGAYKWDGARTYQTKSSNALEKLARGTILHQAKEELYQIAKAHYIAEYDRRMKVEDEKRQSSLSLDKRQELKVLARKNLVAKCLIPE